jgi:hypothetical protein
MRQDLSRAARAPHAPADALEHAADVAGFDLEQAQGFGQLAQGEAGGSTSGAGPSP